MSDDLPTQLSSFLPIEASVHIVRDSYGEPRDEFVVKPLRESVSSAERDAILKSLYNERQHLTRARRLGRASPHDEEFLQELNQYIDEWEARERRSDHVEDVMARLEKLQAATVVVQTEIARLRKK